MLAAVLAREPVSQIVTTGALPRSSSAHARITPVGDVQALGDVAVRPLVLLAHVDELDAAVAQHPLEVVERQRLEPLARLRAGQVAVQLEQPDRVQAARSAARLVLGPA